MSLLETCSGLDIYSNKIILDDFASDENHKKNTKGNLFYKKSIPSLVLSALAFSLLAVERFHAFFLEDAISTLIREEPLSHTLH